jgi:hypothetical protein
MARFHRTTTPRAPEMRSPGGAPVFARAGSPVTASPGLSPTVPRSLRGASESSDGALGSPGQAGLGHDFGAVRVHAHTGAPRAAGALPQRALTIGGLPAASVIQRTPIAGAGPFIKHVRVHLTPPQSAELEWSGTAPDGAPGGDSFTVSTGKGYADEGDPAGTCTRTCCSDPDRQCAPPWNQPGRTGACCTFHGDGYWTGAPVEEHNGWKWWTPVQPYYSARGIALHQHDEVTGQPIGHGCVRMDEENAHRIYLYSDRRKTQVSMDGRAAPVLCEDDRRCAGRSGGAQGSLEQDSLEQGSDETRMAEATEAIPGLEGELS